MKREGSDITIVATSYMVQKSLQVSKELSQEGIEVEVVDPRTLNPFDYDTVMDSVRKTKRAVVVAESYGTASFARHIASRIGEELFGILDAPVYCLGAHDTPIPYAKELEDYILPSNESIKQAVMQSVEYIKA